MNKIKNILLCGFLFPLALFTACSDDEPDASKSVFAISQEPESEFDKWLHREYVETYNIDYKYRMEDIEIDMSYNLSPADLLQSMRLAKIIKHAWLEAYQEVGGVDFIRANAPAILHVIGSAAWNRDGTWLLGTAEGGLKITLYMANWLDPTNIEQMNQYFFHTMHHEFTHILQQTKNYPQEYNLISAADYSPSAWFNRRTLSSYAPLGFVTSYAGSKAVEDITEVTACYLTYTDSQWNDIFQAAGDEGRTKLNKKIEIMKSYMEDVWNIDMDLLREVVNRRMGEVLYMELLEPSWIPTLSSVRSKAIEANTIALLRKDLSLSLHQAEQALEATKHSCQVHQANLLDILHNESAD